MTARALLIVDVQNDFCEGGSLPVAGGTGVAAAITGYLRDHAGDYTAIAGTLDWHIDPGGHFAAVPDWVDTWPVHCVADTEGAEPHPALDTGFVQAWFTKGQQAAAYSGFEGATDAPDGTRVGLRQWLAEREVEAVDVVGLTADHCVRATAQDAVRAGFATRVLLHLTAGVLPTTTHEAVTAMRETGVELVGTPVLAE